MYESIFGLFRVFKVEGVYICDNLKNKVVWENTLLSYNLSYWINIFLSSKKIQKKCWKKNRETEGDEERERERERERRERERVGQRDIESKRGCRVGGWVFVED